MRLLRIQTSERGAGQLPLSPLDLIERSLTPPSAVIMSDKILSQAEPRHNLTGCKQPRTSFFFF